MRTQGMQASVRLLAIVATIVLLSGAALSQAPAECQLRDHADYSAKIKQYTTAPSFSTELVDHLPWSSCVPAPDAFLGHIIGAPDVLDHVKEINAYMRLLE